MFSEKKKRIMERVLIVNQHFLTGGIKTTLINLITYLSNFYEVDVLFLYHGREEIKISNANILPTPKLLEIYKTPIKEYFKDKWSIISILQKLSLIFIKKIIGSEKTTKFVCKKIKFANKYYAAISYSHDIWNGKEFVGGCNYIVLSKCVAKKKFAWIHGEIKSIGLKEKDIINTYQYFDKVVCVSNEVKKSYESLLPVGIKNNSVFIKNIYNYKKINKDANEKCDFISNCQVLVTVSRMNTKNKRADRINVIAQKLKNKKFCFKWIVIGDGKELDGFKENAKELGINDCVIYIGEESNVAKYIKNASLFVLPSESEAYPTVLIESLYLKTPVITTNFPSSYEIIDDGKTGIICDNSSYALSEGILRFFMDNKLRSTIIHNINKMTFSNEESYEKLSEILNL